MKPKIRFRGFSGKWEETSLGKLVNVYDGVHQTPRYTDKGIMFLSVENISTLKSNKFINEVDFNQFYKIYPEKGDILMTRIGDVGTPNVIEVSDKIAYYVSLALLKPIAINPYYLSACIQSPTFQHNLKLRTLTTAIPQKINKDEIGKVECVYSPYKDERQAIASYFQGLDALIRSTIKKIESLKQVKAASLLSMFPQEGGTKPRVRFKGFEGDWEMKTLDNIGFMTAGGTPSTFNPDFWNGNIDWLQSGAIQNCIIHPSSVEKKITEKGLIQSSAYLIRKDSVLIAITGATCANIGFLTFPSAANLSVVSIETYEKYNSMFIYQILLTQRSQILSFKGGSAQSGVSLGNLRKVLIQIPKCIDEQIAIGKYFSSLDSQITLQTQRLEKLKQIKSACLDNMFV